MRKFWGILLFIALCNVTSLVVRVSMLEAPTANDIQCFIGEQETEDIVANNHQSYALQQNDVTNIGALRTSLSESCTSKHTSSTHNKASQVEYRGYTCNNAYIAIHKEPYAHLFSRIKDHYIYALRHIII